MGGDLKGDTLSLTPTPSLSSHLPPQKKHQVSNPHDLQALPLPQQLRAAIFYIAKDETPKPTTPTSLHLISLSSQPHSDMKHPSKQSSKLLSNKHYQLRPTRKVVK